MSARVAAIAALLGLCAILAGVYLLWGIPVTLIVGGVLIVVSAAVLYDPNDRRAAKAAREQARKVTQPRSMTVVGT